MGEKYNNGVKKSRKVSTQKISPVSLIIPLKKLNKKTNPSSPSNKQAIFSENIHETNKKGVS